ncbi:hypothetical protein MTO96_035143 [Rhipicephalus appendiculatus]
MPADSQQRARNSPGGAAAGSTRPRLARLFLGSVARSQASVDNKCVWHDDVARILSASLSTSAFGSCDDAVSAVDVAREDRGKTAGRGLSTFLAAFNEHCVMQRQSNAE